MRVRVAVRSINPLVAERRLLNPLRQGRHAWQLWSHKALRYAAPVFWIVALVANLALAANPLCLSLLALQIPLIASGVAGSLLNAKWPQLLTRPYYLLTNVASCQEIFRYLRGERVVTWKPIR